MLDRPGRVEYCDEASDISYKLVSLAGLDPKTATIAEMDSKDARFALVKACMDDTWTDTYQLCYVSDEHRSPIFWYPPKFRLATAEETETARQHTATVRETAKAWSCNHCHEFFEAWNAEAKPVIFQHLKDCHDIFDPNPLVDFVPNAQCWPTLEVPCKIPLPVSSPQCFQCALCGYSSPRRFDLDGVRNHLQNDHGMAYPTPAPYYFTVDPEMIVGLE
ncbi:hypothetical protein H1R20_g14291, partial [Candolleomyces eurysporus]